MVVFTVALYALTPSVLLLVLHLARVLQAAGAGLLVPAALGLVIEAFLADRRQHRPAFPLPGRPLAGGDRRRACLAVAACAVPPCRIGDTLHVDGEILDNLPVGLLPQPRDADQDLRAAQAAPGRPSGG